ncbi:1-acyl-sn-glycerol-3-phosphate acyltransferase [Gramella jeungdoensis]|uniref:1-acyl-sn-glycerol-3-phosphate acyltransferase n=1 Tax=Gramella jeungdoensis TaxID=708091 RepID=A0ABT0Z395_9FLAO|nr:1-acyl-sn-glycerol-3-phosphate acyltransferase [Gramella jeungdoensis]MCM8570213.1 1-acyl-sn-glycerol-3-phosphate acyltransferase [Gramella jeungdoensis]
MRWLAKLIFFNILGWKLENNFDPATKKCVVIVAPHTSSYDFFIGLLVRKIMGIHLDFVAKKELFRPPFGWYFRMVGGSPLDRTGNQKKVDVIAEMFEKNEIFRLALSPEGTRKKTERWKTGFYFIALKARVPIIPVAFDFGTKTVTIHNPVDPSGNLEKDLVEIQNLYKGVEGKIPENF